MQNLHYKPGTIYYHLFSICHEFCLSQWKGRVNRLILQIQHIGCKVLLTLNRD